MARSPRGFSNNSQKLKARIKTDTTFAAYFNMLEKMSENTFKWDNLPLQVDPIFIEKMLFQYGLVAVFKDEIAGLVALPAMQCGGFNIYGEPKMVRAFSPRTGFSQQLKISPVLEATDAILIHNTNRDLNSSLYKTTLAMFADRLTEMKRTEDVNVFAQRTPVVVAVPDGKVETYRNLLDTVDNFRQVVLGYKGLDAEEVKAIKTDAPWIAKDVDELFVRTWNEAISFLGISNVSIEKKERVSNDEVARAMGGSLAFRNIRQEPRERAVELMNAKWNVNAKVTFSEDMFDLELFSNTGDRATEADETEGNENE